MTEELRKVTEADVLRRCREVLGHGHVHHQVYGIGDDAAVVRVGAERRLLLASDQLVESVHFKREWISARQLGAKGLAVNVSDVAAMGGVASWALVGVALPQNIAPQWVEDFLQGLHECAQRHGVMVVGGDTTSSPRDIMISLTVMGQMHGGRTMYRSGVQTGDILAVTGPLGDAAGGLMMLQQQEGHCDPDHVLLRAINAPEPEAEVGPWLAAQEGVHAMIDVSDGLATDARNLADASGCGFSIELGHLPLSTALRQAAPQLGRSAESLAVSGGEEYCLAVAIHPEHIASVQSRFLRRFQRPLYAVGKAQADKGLQYLRDGKPVTLDLQPWTHFPEVSGNSANA